MNNCAHYSALGKIDSVLIFDPTQRDETPADAQCMKTEFGSYCTSLKNIAVHILYDRLSDFSGCQEAHVIADNFTDAHPHALPDGTGMPDPVWAQDHFHLIPDPDNSNAPLLLFNPELHHEVAEQIAYFSGTAVNAQPATIVWAGGNVLRGKIGRKDYLLIGALYEDMINPGKLAEQFQVDATHLYLCSNQMLNIYPKFFFHLDNYLTILGPVPLPGGKREVVMVAKSMNPLSDEFNKGLDNIAETLEKEGFYTACRSRLLIVDDESPESPYLISYANCLVENYYEKNVQIIRVYIPDYRKELAQHVEQLSIDGTKVDRYHRICRNLFHALNGNIDWPPQQHVPFTTNDVETLIEKAEQEVKSEITKLFGKAEFVTMHGKFRDFAKEGGSLHCRVKVLVRDAATI